MARFKQIGPFCFYRFFTVLKDYNVLIKDYEENKHLI